MQSKKGMWLIGGAIVAIAVIFLVYRLVLTPSTPKPTLVGLEPANLGRAGLAGDLNEDEFFRLLLTLERIDLSDARQILPRLTGFVDFSVALEPQLAGRPNPFSPIGTDPLPSAPVETSTSTATGTGA